MQFTDRVVVAGTRRRDDGYLVADARIARTGIQLYAGREVGRPDLDVVRVYRPGEEVFSDATLKSAAHRPVTNDHPPESVNSKNWKRFSVGQTADEVTGEGIFIRVPLMVSDEAAIKDIEAGKREVSAGYTCELEWTDGVTPGGEAYDAIQKNIRLNHVAIVASGRAGSEVRIGDGAAPWGASPILPTADERNPHMADNLRTVIVDGLSVSVTDQGAQAIEKLTKDRDDARKAVADAEAGHSEAIKAKDAELAKKDAEIDDLKGKIMDDAALDARVQARADLIGKAIQIAKDVKVEGLSDAAIRKAVVVAKLGDAAVKDKPDAYIDARFDILAEGIGKTQADPVRGVIADGVQHTDAATAAAQARTAYIDQQRNAWKGEASATKQ